MATYLKLFTNHSDYETYIGNNPLLPNSSLCIEDNLVHFTPASEESNLPPDDEIWYTTVSGDAIYAATGDMEGTYVGPSLISNTSPNDNNGKGIIKFDGPITKLGYIDSGFTEYYPVIGPLDFDKCLTSITFPSCLYYLGYYSLPYCTEIESITIPDTITELWTFPNYDDLGTITCPFTMSRKYNDSVITGGLNKIKTSKGEYTWIAADRVQYDYMNITLANGKEYKLLDFIAL